MSDDVRDNILSPAHWVRILYMALFGVICWVLGIILTVLIVLQALFSLVTGSDNENLRHLGAALSKYFYQILLFLTYKSDDKPFPFAPFPDTVAAGPLDPDDPASPASGPSGASAASGTGRPSANAGAAGAAFTAAAPRTAASHEPVAEADFASEHEPDAVGNPANADPEAAEQGPSAAGDDVFADISFTSPRQGNGPRRETGSAGDGRPEATAGEEHRRQDEGL